MRHSRQSRARFAGITRREAIIRIGAGFACAASWAFAEGGTASPGALRRDLLLQYQDSRGRLQAVRSRRDWNQRRKSILEAMQGVMGTFPGSSKRCPLDIQVVEEVDCGSFIRRSIFYTAEPGGTVPAYLLIPKACLQTGKTAFGALCLHQTHAAGRKVVVGLGNSPNDEYAVELVNRGFVCLAPAYPLLADYAPDLATLGYKSGVMKAIWNNVRGLDLLESFPFVKRGRFAAIGHSLGGHTSIFTAVFDERIQCVVSSCGFDAFADYMDGNIKGWTSTRYMPALADYKRGELPFDFHEVIAALAPRTLFVSAPMGDTNFKWWSVDNVADAVRPIYDLYHAGNNLIIEHPNCGHLFPEPARLRAYGRIELVLNGR